MAEMAGLKPPVTIPRVRDHESCYAPSNADAKRYSNKHRLVVVGGCHGAVGSGNVEKIKTLRLC